MVKYSYNVVGKDEMFKIWHASKEATFIYMHTDGGSVVCSEKTYPISRGVLCFIGEGRYHYTMPSDPRVYVRSKLFINQKRLTDILYAVSPHYAEKFSAGAFVYAILREDIQSEIECELMKLSAATGSDEQLEAKRCSTILKLISIADEYSVESVPRVGGNVSLGIEYINAHIFDELTIDGICRAVHVSKYHFCRRFKATVGLSVMEYILKTRIVMAKAMLAKERISVSEVSARCGFSSLSYFSRVFKESVGMTPLEYRRCESK